VKFWDASAIVPLLTEEATTERLRGLARRDPGMFVWRASEVECVSALARLERSAVLDVNGVRHALDRLRKLADRWHEIEPSEVIRENAMRFLRVYPLRAADALQLAAGFIAADRRPASVQFVTLDERLADAAQKEGFSLVDIPAS
jgi:predicted nucleic acid-binding protein